MAAFALDVWEVVDDHLVVQGVLLGQVVLLEVVHVFVREVLVLVVLLVLVEVVEVVVVLVGSIFRVVVQNEGRDLVDGDVRGLVVDLEGVREALDIVVDTSITAGRVVRTLKLLKSQRGVPRSIRVDNGPEMTAQAFADWCSENEVRIDYIQPGKPNQNAYIERFNRTYRTEVLDPHIFSNLSQVRDISWAWLLSYNEERPHKSLGNIPPAEFKRRLLTENSIFEL